MSDSLQLHELYSPWNSLGQNTRVGSLSLTQDSFPTQGLKPGLPHCRWILYQLSHRGSRRILEWVAYPFCSESSPPRNRARVSALRADSLQTELPGNWRWAWKSAAIPWTFSVTTTWPLVLTQFSSVQLLSRVQLFATQWAAAHQASLSIINSRSLLKFMSITSVMPSNHLILCFPLLPPSIFPSIRVFSRELVLHIRCPQYWSFSFSISPSH